MQDDDAMHLALDMAARAAAIGEVPVGAVILGPDGELLAQAHNQPIGARDPTAHAEIAAIRLAAAKCGNYRLSGCTLFVTLEPCAMCAGAISHARLARLVYGASDPKGGAVEHGPRLFEQPTLHHRPSVTAGLRADEASAMLKAFFRARR